jgi:acyl-ACP thioesterase
MGIELTRLPVWDDRITVHTWARGVERSLAMRDFEVLDCDGNVLIRASSGWLVIDLQSRRPVRHHVFPDGVPVIADRLALGRGPRKLSRVVAGERRRLGRAMYGDLDVNGHVGYARYLGWILDSYDTSFRSRYAPLQIEMNYLRECFEGDTLWLASVTDGDGLAEHTVLRGDDEACRTQFCWRRLAEARKPSALLESRLGIGGDP